MTEQPTLDDGIRQAKHCGKLFYIKNGSVINPPPPKPLNKIERTGKR